MFSSSAAPLLVTPAQLHDLAKSGNVSVLDASWYMPNSPRKPRDEFLSKRVHGANFWDLDEVATPSDLGLKHMMPEERVFANACGMSSIYKSFITRLTRVYYSRGFWDNAIFPCGHVGLSFISRLQGLTVTQIRLPWGVLVSSHFVYVQGIWTPKIKYP